MADNEKKTGKKDNGKFLADVKERFQKAVEFDSDDRQEAEDDLSFLNGDDQWDSLVRNVREESMRPCLTINKLPGFLDSIVGEQRQNRPSIKIVGVDSDSDPEVATIYTGLVRNIEAQSDAELAYDTAFESAAACGRGAYRIVTRYEGPDTFDQDIFIERIPNPFVFYYDPSAIKLDLSDAKYQFLTEMMSLEEYERRFPKHEPIPWDHLDSTDQNWFLKDQIRVAEYWEKTYKKTKVYLLRDGTVTQQKPEDESLIEAERTHDVPKIMAYYLSGNEVIEGPSEWPSQYYSVIPVWGKELWVGGKRKLRGAIRFAKDGQRMYNYFRSVSVETTAMSPKDPWILSAEQIGGFSEQWQDAHQKTYAYLLYSHHDGQPPPYRAGPPQLSTAIAGEVQIADQDMRDTTGIHEASMGIPSNEKSGRAIRERRMSGDRSSFPYMDNLTRALRQGGRVILDLIPKIYDHDRIVRILGEDGKENFVPVNVQPGDPNQIMSQVKGKNFPGNETPINRILNDLTVGKYDVVVTVGPSYDTQRQENADSMIEFAQALPQQAPMFADLIARSQDWPEAQKIANRLKKMIDPAILGKDEIEEEEATPPQQEDPMQDPKVALKMVELQLKREQAEVDTIKTLTEAILNIAKAEGMEAGQQMQIYQAMLEQIRMKYEGRKQEQEMMMKQQQMQAAQTPPGGPQLPQ